MKTKKKVLGAGCSMGFGPTRLPRYHKWCRKFDKICDCDCHKRKKK